MKTALTVRLMASKPRMDELPKRPFVDEPGEREIAQIREWEEERGEIRTVISSMKHTYIHTVILKIP